MAHDPVEHQRRSDLFALLNRLISDRFHGATCGYTKSYDRNFHAHGALPFCADRRLVYEIREFIELAAPAIGVRIRYPHSSDGTELDIKGGAYSMHELLSAMRAVEAALAVTCANES